MEPDAQQVTVDDLNDFVANFDKLAIDERRLKKAEAVRTIWANADPEERKKRTAGLSTLDRSEMAKRMWGDPEKRERLLSARETQTTAETVAIKTEQSTAMWQSAEFRGKLAETKRRKTEERWAALDPLCSAAYNDPVYWGNKKRKHEPKINVSKTAEKHGLQTRHLDEWMKKNQL